MLLKKTPEKLQAIFDRAAATYHIRPGVLESFAQVESGFNPDAVGDDGKSVGLMQIYHATARALGVEDWNDLFNPQVSVDLAARLLLDQKSRGLDGLDAIAAYNSGAARKNNAGQYVNSKGVPGVQQYVDRVSAAMRSRGVDPARESLFDGAI